MEVQQQVIHKLNDLIQLCKDGEQGFRQAAGEVHSKQYKALMWAAAQRRKDFASLLQEEVRKMGAKPARKGSFVGLLHRGWMNLLYQMSLHSDKVVVKECRRAEESALNVYEDIFENKRLPGMEPLLQNSFVHLIETRDRLNDIVTGGYKKEESEENLLHL